MIKATEDNQYVELTSPTSLPKASGFLWNEKMMIHVNCRGVRGGPIHAARTC